MNSPGQMGVLVVVPIISGAILEAAQPSDPPYLWGIVVALGGVVTSMATFAWKQRELRAKVERELGKRDTELAVCKTQLSAYGKSAPELAEVVRNFGEQLADLIEENEGYSSLRRRGQRERMPWPTDRPRPTAPRRQR